MINTLRPRQNGRHFPDNIFKWIFLNENVWISIKISLKFFPKGPINNIPAVVQIMAWRRSGDKPLSYLNQWWLVYRRIYASLSLNEFEKIWCWCISFSLYPVVSQWCMHMCFSQLFHHCFNKSGLGPYNGLLLNPILTFIVNWTLWNRLQWNLNQNMKISLKKIHLKILSAKY